MDTTTLIYFGGIGFIYLVLLFTVAAMTFRKRHFLLFGLGFLLPLLWLIGAVLPERR